MIIKILRGFFYPSLIVMISLFPFTAHSHDGLDPYGCHEGPNRGDYHCHKGVFSGLSFDSKTEMLRQLNLQSTNRGRFVPHQLVEQDITSPEVETKEEPVAAQREDIKQPEKPLESSVEQQLPAQSAEEYTERPMRPETKAKEKPPVPKEKPQASSKPSKSKQQQSVRVESIRSDGTVIYQDLHGQRFYIDDNGNKVHMRGKR